MATPQPAVDGAVEVALGTSRHHTMELLHTARREQWHVDLVEKALTDCAEQVEHYRGWWADVKVTSDKRIRDETARALDCGEHGRIIDGLEKQLTSSDNWYRAAERSRLAYVSGISELRESLARIQVLIRVGDTDGLPDLSRLLEMVVGVLDDVQKNARRR